MRVNQYKFKTLNSGGFINIPISLDFKPIDQAEVVESDFVAKEMEDAVNPIIDYEKIRLTPILENGNEAQEITYKLNLIGSNGSFPPTTTYETAEYEYDDLKFNKRAFKRSFIRLAFYDSDIITNQNLLTFATLFCELSSNDLIPELDSSGNINPDGGLPKPLNQIPMRFTLVDPIETPEGQSEGYYIYHFKDEIPNSLYMRPSFNNASNGRTTALITDPTPQYINNFIGTLHMKYDLKQDNQGYYYEIDKSYSNNVTESNGNVIINLYEMQIL